MMAKTKDQPTSRPLSNNENLSASEPRDRNVNKVRRRGYHDSFNSDDSSSDDDDDDFSDVPGAVRVCGVSRGIGSGGDSMEDEQSLAIGGASTVSSRPPVPVIAELVPENDTVIAENERLREELQRERDERDRQQQQVVIVGAAEPIDERKSKFNLVYVGIAVLLVAVSVSVGVTVGQKNETTDDSTATIQPRPETSSAGVATSPTYEPSQSMVPTMQPSAHPMLRPTERPSVNPTQPPRFDLFLDSFLTQEPRLNQDVLQNSSSPQYQALVWMAEDDGLALEPFPFSIFALERFILATLFFATGGNRWANQFRFLQDSSICEWNNGVEWSNEGVWCNADGLVSKIYMDDNQLIGMLPTEIWLLPDMKEISFGSFAAGSGSNDLQMNASLTEMIGIWDGFSRVDFSTNYHIDFGTIPESIGQLTSLTYLDFYQTTISGTIPTTIGRLTLLTHLSLGDTGLLSGTIPSELGALVDLRHLGLNTNDLEGTVPTELGALTNLEYLSLRENYGLRGDLDFLCTEDFYWEYFSSDCIAETDEEGYRTICSCCTVCYC